MGISFTAKNESTDRLEQQQDRMNEVGGGKHKAKETDTYC